jgi:hypothetical protein
LETGGERERERSKVVWNVLSFLKGATQLYFLWQPY